MKTVRLDVRQWLICTGRGPVDRAVAEIRKAVLRQTAAKAIHPASAPASAPGPESLPLSARRVPDMAEYPLVRQSTAAEGRRQ